MNKKKTIYMNEPLTDLAKKTPSNFSRRLGEIVERYQTMLKLEPIPGLSETESEIMGEVVAGSVIDARKIRGLHLDPLDAATGTAAEKKALAEKIKPLTAGQRLALIEKVEGN